MRPVLAQVKFSAQGQTGATLDLGSLRLWMYTAGRHNIICYFPFLGHPVDIIYQATICSKLIDTAMHTLPCSTNSSYLPPLPFNPDIWNIAAGTEAAILHRAPVSGWGPVTLFLLLPLINPPPIRPDIRRCSWDPDIRWCRRITRKGCGVTSRVFLAPPIILHLCVVD